MGVFKDLWGTTKDRFKLGIGGPQIKNDSGQISARNTADSAYTAIRASLFATYGDDFELNAGAAGAGADWKFTLTRPSTGMTHALEVVFPATDPTPNDVLAVDTLVGDVITLKWMAVAGGSDNVKVDSTNLAFGSSSPVAMFTKPAGSLVRMVKVIIDTPFNGTSPQLSVGITGTTSKYMPTTAVDLKAAATTVFEYDAGLPVEVGSEALIATYAADSSSAGAARIEVEYVIPA